MYILCFGDVWWCTCVFFGICGACGACMCMWCMYGYICFWWSMCCMYVYMHLCRYMCLVVHVCACMMDIYAPLIGDACDAHVCI